ncbi:MAG: PfkB family carbohydrate kinase [Actinobacteria bacterium]|nr:PfkB family carbohydrate kinase [Actinomycetota bacterium]
MKKYFDLISIGDNCVDIYNQEKKEFYPGGNAVNVSVIARRQGLSVCYYGIFGNDIYGEILKSNLLKEGVNLDYCKTMEGKTGFTIVGFNNGDRVFLDDNIGVQNYFDLSDNFLDVLKDSRINFYSGFTSWISDAENEQDNIKNKNLRLLPEIKKYSDLLAFDFSNIADLNYIISLSSYIDIAFFSMGSKGDIFVKEFLKNIQGYFSNGSLIVLTLGKNGSMALKNKEVFSQEPIVAARVDSLGCGDAFIGAFLAEHIKTDGNIKKCLKYGTEIATEKLGHYGAW